MRGSKKLYAVLAGAVCLAATQMASAAFSMNYGNYVGDTVNFLQVTESTLTDSTALYGAPTQTDDALNFNPTNFGAFSQFGGLPDITDGTLAMNVEAQENQAITSFNISEAGDYTLVGAGTHLSFVQVVAPVIIRVLEIDDVGVAPIGLNTALSFTPSSGDYYLDVAGDPGAGVIWTGSLSVDLDAFLVSQGKTGHATLISVEMDNQLLAFSEAGSIAHIKKKNIGGFAITVNNPVPEPASLSLLAIGATAMLRRRRA